LSFSPASDKARQRIREPQSVAATAVVRLTTECGICGALVALAGVHQAIDAWLLAALRAAGHLPIILKFISDATVAFTGCTPPTSGQRIGHSAFDFT
jgi:hypothetical protein